jgi:endonuclease-3
VECSGEPQWAPDLDPLGELVLTILSQHTAHAHSRRALQALRARFLTWEGVRDADVREIEAVIRPAGLARTKAPRIKAILVQIGAEHGALELGFLAALPVEDALRWLNRLPGVGQTTAACVLLFGLGRPVFPVDTGIHRVARRMGIVPESASPAEVQAVVQAAIPARWVYALHVNSIRHARQLCTPRHPRCEVCPVNDVCDHFRAHQRE